MAIWHDALLTHAMLSAAILVFGWLTFWTINQRGTPRTRWQGYWTFGGAVFGYQTLAGLYLLRCRSANIFFDEDVGAAGLFGLLIGVVLGNVIGVFTSHTQQPHDPPPDDD